MPDPNDSEPFVSAEEQQAYRDMLSEYLAQPPRVEPFFEAYIDNPDAAPGEEPEVRAFPVAGAQDLPGTSTTPGIAPDPFGMGGMFQPPSPPAEGLS